DQELQRKQLAAARSPLANRAIVWPISPGEPEPPKRGTAAVTPAAVRTPATLGPTSSPAPTAATSQPAALVAPPPPPLVPPTPPRHRGRTDEDEHWQSRVFNN
ncbi:MAG: hypothetical protein ABL908_18180, partial [Hyphomicrobium sp.]